MTTFVASSPDGVELLVPPGAQAPGAVGTEAPDSDVVHEGLWRHAQWTARHEPVLGIDAPARISPLRTQDALRHLDWGYRDTVALLLEQQLRMAWLMTETATGAQPTRRHGSRRHAALLMALTAEARQAFPDASFWRLTDADAVLEDTWPEHYGQFLACTAATPVSDPSVAPVLLNTRQLLNALSRALWLALRRRRQIQTTDIWMWAAASSCAAVPEPPAPACEAPRGSRGGTISAIRERTTRAR